MAVVLVFCLGSTAAVAQNWRPTVQSCVTTTATNGCDAASPFSGAWDVAVSPDGKHAYAAAYSSHALITFDRNPTNGRLTQKQCIIDGAGGGGCAGGRAMQLPSDVEISADGNDVYLASESGGIAVFDRAAGTGLLTQKAGLAGCLTDDGSGATCTDTRGGSGPFALRLSKGPNPGRNVYAATDGGSLLIFDRNTGTGNLTQKLGPSGCVREDGGDDCANGTGLGFVRQFALSGDGRHLYAPSATRSGIIIYDRSTTTGTIAQKPEKPGCITADGFPVAGEEQCGKEPRLAGNGVGVEIAPDGNHLYVPVADKVLVFRRAADGTLSFASCANDAGDQGCSVGRNLVDLFYSGFTPDGEDLIVGNGFGGTGLAFFRRNTSTGALSQVAGADACLTSNGTASDSTSPGPCRAHPAVARNGHITVVNDSQFHAGFYEGSAILALKRDFVPTCSNQSVGVPHNTSVAVPLSCSDRNGDPITLQIVQAPGAGQLGSVDQGAKRVFYNPFSGFSGTDSFTYRAATAGGGLISPAATVTLGVAGGAPPQPPPPPPPPPPPGKLPNLSSTAGFDTLAFSAYTQFVNLSVNSLPAGSTVTVTCKTKKKSQQKKGCPKTKRYRTPRARARLNLRKPFAKKKVPLGAKITITIAAPGFNSKRITYTIRKRKRPARKVQCIPPGGKAGACI